LTIAKKQVLKDREAFSGWVFCPRENRAGGGNVPGKSPGPSVKKPKTYEALKKKGMSKSRAARISNAQAKKSR
jgi:hypothetical protein